MAAYPSGLCRERYVPIAGRDGWPARDIRGVRSLAGRCDHLSAADNATPRLARRVGPSARSAQLPDDPVERRRHRLLPADLVPALAALPKGIERPPLWAVPPEAPQR